MKFYFHFILLIISLGFGLGGEISAQPDWGVNSHQFEFSMTVTGKLFIDGEFSSDENDLLAAFAGDECRGTARVKYDDVIGEYFVFLLIYSNSINETIKFRIYDYDKNEIYEVKDSIQFSINKIMGSIDDPVVFAAENPVEQVGITSFSVYGQVGKSVFIEKNINLEVNWDVDLSNLVAEFKLSDGAKAFVSGVEQTSGVTTNDFSNPVKYTIKSLDQTVSSVYTVYTSIKNDIPTNIYLDHDSIEENSQSSYIGSFAVETENPNESHILSLVSAGNTDNRFFYISGNQLRTNHPLNYEEQSLYRINVRADDEKGGVVEMYFTIQVIDVNDSPSNISLKNRNMSRLISANAVVGNLTAIDEDENDRHTFTLINGTDGSSRDNNKFYIENNELKSNTELDFQVGTEYEILVQAEDLEGAKVIVPFTLTSELKGTAPIDILLSNYEVWSISNLPVFIGTFTCVDQDQETGHVYSFTTDAETGLDNNYFAIVADSLFLVNPQPVAEKSSYKFEIVAKDSLNNQVSKQFLITVKEKLERTDFFLSNDRFPENKPYNTIVGYFDSQKYNSAEYTFSLPLEVNLENYRNNEFTLKGRTLLTNQVFDYESEKEMVLQVEVSNGVTTIIQEIRVMVTDQNDPPTAIMVSSNSISESTSLNTVVATLDAIDQDTLDVHQYDLAIGNGFNDEGNSYFKISDNQLILTKPLNFENKEYHNVLLRVTDSQGAYFEQSMRLQVTDANDPPTFLSEPAKYVLQDEIYIYPIELADAEGDNISVTFAGLPDWFAYYPETNLLVGTAGNEQVGNISFTIVASDGKAEASQQVFITVINKNDPPEIGQFIDMQYFFSKKENNVNLPLNCIIDPDANDQLNFTLSMENNAALPDWLNFDSASLVLSGNPGMNDIGQYNLKLTATDKGNLKEWMVFELVVTFPVGIDETTNMTKVEFYPNPVHSTLNIKMRSLSEKAFVNILTLSGRKVEMIELPAKAQQQIDLRHLESGVYLIQIQQEYKFYTGKLVKY